MHLSGRFLLILDGPIASRREDIAGLLAGGAAYLSTLTESKGAHEAQTEDGDTIITGAKVAMHAAVVQISPDDAFREMKKEGHPITLPADPFVYQTHGYEDALRRLRIYMHKGTAIIILHGRFTDGFIAQAYRVAQASEYETVFLAHMEQRMSILAAVAEEKGLIDEGEPEEDLDFAETVPAHPLVNPDEEGVYCKPPERVVLTATEVAAPSIGLEEEVADPAPTKCKLVITDYDYPEDVMLHSKQVAQAVAGGFSVGSYKVIQAALRNIAGGRDSVEITLPDTFKGERADELVNRFSEYDITATVEPL